MRPAPSQPRRRSARRTSPRARRRAFALPLVILLTLVGAFAVAILLDRQSAATLTVRRHVDSYHEHHIAFGMREMVSRWLRQVRGGILENLDPDSRAFSLVLPSGHKVNVYFQDAQGLAPSDTSQLTGRRREIADFMKAYLETFANPDDMDALFRPAGPSTICVTSAPRPVLVALAAACVEPDQVEQVVQALESMASGTSSLFAGDAGASSAPAATNAVLADLDISDQAKRELVAMTTTIPALWRVVCEEDDSRGPLWRAGGLMDLSGRAAGSTTYDQGGPFLTWEQLPLDGPLGR